MARQFDGLHAFVFKMETFEGTGQLRIHEVVETCASYVAQEFVPLEAGC